MNRMRNAEFGMGNSEWGKYKHRARLRTQMTEDRGQRTEDR
jgi:hypothetical protein